MTAPLSPAAGLFAQLWGRGRRLEYWLAVAGLAAAEAAVHLAARNPGADALAPLLPWLLIVARRLHDIGVPGVWALMHPGFDVACIVGQLWLARVMDVPSDSLTPYVLPVVVVVTMGVVVLLGVWPGEAGDNRFGRGRGTPAVDLGVFE